MNASTQAELEELRRMVWQLRDTLAAHRAVVWELAERFANIRRNPGCWEAECRAALAHPLVQQARETTHAQ